MPIRFRTTGAVVLLITATGLSGCAVERAVTASNAKSSMIGLSKSDVLACMGIPHNKASEDKVEVWTYTSGDGQHNTVTGATGVGGSGASAGLGFSSSSGLSCTISVVFTSGAVSRVNYTGPTGGLLTKGEQCAYAVENCTR